jgi:hypothetical protein
MFVRDFRTSPDGTMVLVRFTSAFSGESPDRLDVVDAVTGEAIGTDLPLALPSFDSVTPRWLPDSSGLYGIDSTNARVERVDPDGGGLADLYVPPTPPFPLQTFLVDFVVAPSFTAGTASTTRCAYVRVDGFVTATEIGPTQQEAFVVDVIGGGQTVSTTLDGFALVSEMTYQPDGARVWVSYQSLGRGGNVEVALPSPGPSFEALIAYSATDASEVRSLPFPISSIDLDRATQRVVVYQDSFTEDADFPNPGLYLLSPDLQTQTQLTFTGFAPRGAARFLRSWRLTPGDVSPGNVR